jgi:hypothetical protein
MAAEHRRVIAQTAVHARAVADNLVNQGYRIDQQHPAEWTLRRRRWWNDSVVTIAIQMPFGDVAPPVPPPPSSSPAPPGA